MISPQLLALVMQNKKLQEKIQLPIQTTQQPKMKTLPQAFLSEFYMLGLVCQHVRSLPEVFLKGRLILKTNYTSEFEPSPSDSGEPKEHTQAQEQGV